MDENRIAKPRRKLPRSGWFGLSLIIFFWVFNWQMDGLRTHVGFFPLWLGYCLLIDGLVFKKKGTSLRTRSIKRYIGLFIFSAPVWWVFELLNWRVQNWHYAGREFFTDFEYFLLASLSFSTVIPAVFSTAEYASTCKVVQGSRIKLSIKPTKTTTIYFFVTGLVMIILLIAWPRYFFPFLWISLYFITEPINIWLGHDNLAIWTRKKNWGPVQALWIGVLLTAFFWELWNYYSYPKWFYTIPGVDFWHIFEMPILGYLGYLPFSLELYSIYNLAAGLLKWKDSKYLQFTTS